VVTLNAVTVIDKDRITRISNKLLKLKKKTTILQIT